MMDPERFNALRKRVIIRFGLSAIVVLIILYALSGTIHYWQGWLYWAVLIVPMSLAVAHFMKSDPEFLERRMKNQEKEKEQRLLVLIGNAICVIGFLAIAVDLGQNGLDQIPGSIIIAADAGIIIGYSIILWVFKKNSYASRTIEVVPGQKVITTGPYSVVRHPMYVGFLAIYLLTPVALGSFRAFPVFLLYIPIIIWRIIGEEKVLMRELPGYLEYCRERRYRLVPYIW